MFVPSALFFPSLFLHQSSLSFHLTEINYSTALTGMEVCYPLRVIQTGIQLSTGMTDKQEYSCLVKCQAYTGI
jgi:hypothetical protein